jgi:CubicO group peptidase (beta-lactamase class C family)
VFLSAIYSPEYLRRIILWGESDVQDYTRFPARAVEPGQQVFKFSLPADPAAAAAEVQAAFGGDMLVGSRGLDTFLQSSGTQAFLVIRDDELLYEKYYNGTERDSIVTSFSVAKSYVSTLVAIAVEERAIKSIDDSITTYLPELLQRDPRFGKITVRHLLNMASGIRYVEDDIINQDDSLTYYYPDLRQLALERTQIVGEPGGPWLYNNYNPLLLGLILERTTKMPVAQYLQEKLWKPMGAEFPASWSLDSEATAFEKMESGMNARAIDFAKLGRLYLHGGRWDGEQIIPASWVEAATRLDGSIDRAQYYPPYMQRLYGHVYHQLFWWGVEQDDGEYAFAARGMHGQIIFVWPAKQLIIVRFGERFGITSMEWMSVFIRAAEQLKAP